MPNDQTAAAPAVTAPEAKAPQHGAAYVQIGYLFAAVGALLFSTKSIIIKLAYAEQIDAVTLLALRMGLSLPFYFVIAALAVREARREGKPLPSLDRVMQAGAVGLLGYWFASWVDFYGLEFISAQFERLILFTYPLFVVIFGALFFGQPFRLRALAAIGVSYLGLALIFGEKFSEPGSNVAAGTGLVLAAAVAFALYQLLAKNLIGRIGPRLFTCIAMTGAAIGCFVQFGLTHPMHDLMVTPRVFWLGILIAIGATVLPSFFLNAALHRISAQANATIGTLSPVMTIALAVMILGEPLTLLDAIGTALVLAGVGWFTLADQKGRK
jgi:drug/metabolite transporter (DMT)-like permease